MSENKISLSKEQVELIEELAHVNDTMGSQPAMSKIIALLTVSDELELTFDQIKDTLDLSKSAVSQALNQLLLTKKVSYKTKIGDRKRYFHIRVADWDAQIMEQFKGVAAMVSVNKKILAKRSAKTKDFNRDFGRMTDFLSLIHNQVIDLYNMYKKETE